MTTFPVTDMPPKQSTNPFRPSPMTPDEISKVEQIVEVTCCSKEDALKHLRRKGGNVEQAVDAIFNSEPAEDMPTTSSVELESLRTAAAGVVSGASNSGKNSPPTIDLTGEDDEELKRAFQASLEDQGPTLRPSDRAPHPDWAMVSSDTQVQPDILSRDDREMSQAIEASLHFEIANNGYDEAPLEDRVRIGHSPVALRPTLHTLPYAALLLHALFFVPQVRDSVARWRPQVPYHDEHDPIVVSPPRSGPEWTICSLLELFVNMDLARMSELDVDHCLGAFEVPPWNMGVERPGDISYDFYSKLAWLLETTLHSPLLPDVEWQRLFFFRYNYSNADPGPIDLDHHYDMAVVKVDIRGTPDANDLLSCLSQELFPERLQRQHVIFKPSEVVAFQLVRSHSTNGDRELFSFPPHLYLDQFLKENEDLANSRRKLQWDLNAEMEKLARRKAELTQYQDRDVLADLQSSIYYYENVAECEDDERKAQVADTLTKLRTILGDIETELQEIETTVTDHRAKIATAFNCPELQNHKYDLRVVLVHDGFHGRSHLYSYVKYKGVWWKTVDYVVTEVSEETVLNDPAGIHLSAGPYFLIYSAAMSEEEENMPMPWPDDLKDSVKHNNYLFFSQLPEEKRAAVVDPNSPPTAPFIPPVEIEEDLMTLQADDVQTPGDRMDID